MRTVDDLVGLYVKMRDVKSAKQKEFDDWKKAHEEKMAKVEAALLKHLNESGAEAVRTEHGTAFLTRKMRPSIRDFGALREYILKTGHVDLLQRRVSTEALRELRKPDADGVVHEVDGIDVVFEAEVQVRRA